MIILISWPFNDRAYYRLGIDQLEKKRIEFKILNLFELIYPKSKNIFNDRKVYSKEITISSYRELFSYLREEKSIFNFLNIKKETLSIFLLLTLLNKKYIAFNNMPLPLEEKISKKYILFNLFLKSASVGAVVGENERFPLSQSTRFIKIHSIDYDTYLRFEKKQEKQLVNSKYLVFIDQDLPYHLDYIRESEKPYVTAKNYYTSLNTLFDSLEKKTGKEVVIALHPNSTTKHQYHQKTFIGETINLIKYSDGVILHSSTALNFAIIYDKPLCMITTDEIVKSNMNQFNIVMKKALNAELYNIDKSLDISLQRYDTREYFSKYISNSKYKNKVSMEILLKELNL